MLSIRNAPHPRGEWEVRKSEPVYGRRSCTEVWRYKVEANAFKRFNDLREKYPAWPFNICGFRSEPDPAAPKMGQMTVMLPLLRPPVVIQS